MVLEMYWHDIIIDSKHYTYEYFLQEDICRLCWTRNAEQEIITKNDTYTTNSSILHKITDCLNLSIENNTPNKICNNCYQEIERFHDFKVFCENTDHKLKEILLDRVININNDSNVKIEVKNELSDNEISNEDNTAHENEEPEVFTKIKKHRKVKKKNSDTYCRLCCLDLQSKEDLSIHNSDYHGVEENGTVFRCFGCEKRFKSLKTRATHEFKFCKGLKDGYLCVQCDRYLSKRSEYECHQRYHRHNLGLDIPDTVFRCKKCLLSFKTKGLLTKHLVEHSREKNFVCDTCGRVFTRQDYLYKHKLTHAGIKQHQCPHCDFRATQRSSLTVHIRKHTGERPYSCDVCPQKCISSSNLRAHRKRHLGVKKYECTICNKKFGYKISLEEHVASSHVQSETHRCEHCGATYTRIRALRRHLLAKHGKDTQKKVETGLLIEVTAAAEKMEILKNADFEIKDSDNVLLLKHQDGDVYMV